MGTSGYPGAAVTAPAIGGQLLSESDLLLGGASMSPWHGANASRPSEGSKSRQHVLASASHLAHVWVSTAQPVLQPLAK